MEAAIGVIGLTLQVVDTSIKIRRVIETYRSASKDISRLAIKLDRTEAICRAIETRLQDGSIRPEPASLLRQLGPALLQGIKTTLSNLDEIITRLETKASRKGSAKMLGISFLTKKDSIQKLGQDLDEDLMSLQQLMTTELLYVYYSWRI